MRDRGNQSFATRSPTAKTRHLRVRPGFVDEDEPPRIESDLPRFPLEAFFRNVGAVLFGRAERFFLKEIRNLCSAIQMADREHCTPNRSRNSTSVASGCALTNSTSRTRSIFGLRPPPTRGAISPVC